MPNQSYRDLKPTPEAEATYRRWLSHLNDDLTRHTSPERRSEIVRDELFQIFLGRPHGGKINATLTSELATSVLAESFDPRNITLEPEYYGDVDPDRYAERKPLIYLWQMFDKSPLGLNHWLGFRLRCMLGKHIFKHLGKGVKIFHNVEFTFGYNLTIEDNCTIHRNVLLDDRGEIILHAGTSISDYANIYSHTHDINHQADVTNKVTELGPRARVTYHATVLAGASIGEDAMLGAMGLATRPVPDSSVSVGIPAQVKRQKDRPS
ncbi:acyltransferase [Granulicella arctica]|uniref:Acetyltransferase-like isoleucine patch superfamily enzyme n=1 Tax=Granulicella arctica TaxID=940613 RepID=A0A7Y9PFW4_9BACT|nr:acyltransferase [Granulicella arctica]NYF79190.1 acetyltransferase-like isoleucine patch superfamily enzyme [Granulicella arctica]